MYYLIYYSILILGIGKYPNWSTCTRSEKTSTCIGTPLVPGSVGDLSSGSETRGFVVSIRSSSCEKRHSDPDNPDTAQQVPHGKHTLSLITAVGAGSSSGEAFCLFLFWAELQRAGGAGRNLTRSGLHERGSRTKEDARLLMEVKHRRGLLSERPQRQIVDFILCLCPRVQIYICSMWLHEILPGKGFVCSGRIKPCFIGNHVVLRDSLHLWALSGPRLVICSVIKRALFRVFKETALRLRLSGAFESKTPSWYPFKAAARPNYSVKRLLADGAVWFDRFRKNSCGFSDNFRELRRRAEQ